MHGRPLCQMLPYILDYITSFRPESVRAIDRPFLIDACVRAYQITKDLVLLEMASIIAEDILSAQLPSGEWFFQDDPLKDTWETIRTLKEVSGVLNIDISEGEQKAYDYALSNNKMDLHRFRILLQAYKTKKEPEYLETAIRMLKEFDGTNKISASLLLYIVLGDSKFLDAASANVMAFEGLTKEESMNLMLWELSGYSSERYPKNDKLRKYVESMLNMPSRSLEELRMLINYVRGEMRVRKEEPFVGEYRPIMAEKLKLLDDSLGESVVIGRTRQFQEKFGCRGALYIGRVCEKPAKGKGYLGRKVLVDAVKPHVIFICGHRGSGKSYTLGVIAEELARCGLGIAVVIVDPMGVFWSMKYPNWEKDELENLTEWKLNPEGYSNVEVLVPIGLYDQIPEQTRDDTFSIKPGEITGDDWCYLFKLEASSPRGFLIGRVVSKVRDGYSAADGKGNQLHVDGKGQDYTIDDMIKCIQEDMEILSKEGGFRLDTRRAVISRLESAKKWGIFSRRGTAFNEIVIPNQITVIDVSYLGDSVRELISGILARKILRERKKIARTIEAKHLGHEDMEEEIPVTWLLIDEAQQVVPSDRETIASEPLISYAKEGRKPGCGLLLCTQQPAATDDRILSQIDILISHNLTYMDDIRALIKRSPTEIPKEIAKSSFIRGLPVGTPIIMDQSTRLTTNRGFVLKIRPRTSQHAGREASPKLIEHSELDIQKSTEEKAIEEIPAPEDIEKKVVAESYEIPAPKILDIPDDMLKRFLNRLISYRYRQHLFPSDSKVHSKTCHRIISKEPQVVLQETYRLLKIKEWAIDIVLTDEEMPVILAAKGNLRIAFASAKNNKVAIASLVGTSPNEEEAKRFCELLNTLINLINEE
ncbi:MAG: ATP-binding protein [Candidatus Hodarchaeota archaeon]